MANENEEHEEQEEIDEVRETFGKGHRVRVISGEEEGVIGEVVWWGRSKFSPGMRAGVQPEGEDAEKIWVDAKRVRAIDEDGNDLDPQPVVERPREPEAKEIRHIEIPYEFACAITALRIQHGYPESKAPTATVRLDRLNQVEEELGCTIPDPVVAYVASGLGTIRQVASIVEMTREFDADTAVDKAKVLVFDTDKGDYLGFNRGDDREKDVVERYLKESDFEDSEEVELIDHVTDQLDEKVSPSTAAFEVVVDYITEDEPEEEVRQQWVQHSKFGRGMVLSSEATTKGEKLTIRFDGGEVRKLLDRFVEFEDPGL